MWATPTKRPPSGGNGASEPAAEGRINGRNRPAEDKQPAPAASSNGASRTPEGRIKASPVAKRVAEERGIDIAQVTGTGPGGRIVKADVESFDPSEAAPAKEEKPAQQQAATAAAPAAKPTFGKLPEGEDVDTEDVSKLRNRIADRMVTAQQGIPHFYITMEINVDPLLALRKQLNAGSRTRPTASV